jgi:hypothetical protein
VCAGKMWSAAEVSSCEPGLVQLSYERRRAGSECEASSLGAVSEFQTTREGANGHVKSSFSYNNFMAPRELTQRRNDLGGEMGSARIQAKKTRLLSAACTAAPKDPCRRPQIIYFCLRHS